MPFVYFIHEEGNTNCFKIGKTENHPADRMDQLQTGNPRKLVLYRWIETQHHSIVEEYFHVLLAQQHIRGEWFRATAHAIDAECNLVAENDPMVAVSGAWEHYTTEDRIRVKEQRVAMGKYRGKKPPQETENEKNKFLGLKYAQKLLNTL